MGNPTRRTPFTILLLTEEKDMLQHLCRKFGMSQNAVLRRALTAFYRHDVDRVPTCANGNPCLAPHMYAHVSRPDHAPYSGQQPLPQAGPAVLAPSLPPLPNPNQEH